MDDLSELARLVRRVLDDHERRVGAVLDEHEARIGALEAARPSARYSLRAGVAERRRVVVELRESGLSIPQIAQTTGASLATVERDLQCTPHTPPARVVGLDRKSHPTRKNGRVQA